MVKIKVDKNIADTQITGDFETIAAEMVIGVSSVYHTYARTHSKDVADAFRKAFIVSLLTLDEIWETPDELIVIDKKE